MERFGDKVIHASGLAGVAVSDSGVGGYRDDIRLLVGGQCLTDMAGSGEPIHFWHLDIHEDEVIVVFFELVERFLAISGEVGGEAKLLQCGEQDHLINFIIFGEEDTEGAVNLEGGGCFFGGSR